MLKNSLLTKKLLGLSLFILMIWVIPSSTAIQPIVYENVTVHTIEGVNLEDFGLNDISKLVFKEKDGNLLLTIWDSDNNKHRVSFIEAMPVESAGPSTVSYLATVIF